MSGRSAYVRAKNNEQADRRAQKHYSEFSTEDPSLYGYTGPLHGMSRPTVPTNLSYMSPPPHIRRRSHSSAGSGYGYPTAPHLHKPRPIVIASAIEKSDFRTHLDGMSSTLRGKLGGLMKGGKKDVEKGRKRPGTSSADSEFEFNSRSTELTTPSIGAVPSLTASTTPSEGPGSLSTHQSFSIPTRQRQPSESVMHKIRRFEGGGKLPQLGWKSLSNNPELWDENGDTFVYMYMRGSRTKPPPSFRIDSRVIERSGSKMFTDKLYHVSEPDGWPKFLPHDTRSSPSDSPEYQSDYESFRSPTGMRSDDSDGDAIHPIGSPMQQVQRAPRGIQHELYIPWPGAETGIHSTIWHITTRNFFAVMYGASALVGTTLHEALTQLFDRITMFPDYLAKDISTVAWITDYIVRHRFDDVRNNPSYAASLLAFSERPGVQWREGYIEAFVHCVGMLDLGLQTIPEWRHITPHTRMFISNASLEIEQRIHRAQSWLTAFDFNEMWPANSAPVSAARGCFDRLRKWLCKYYENAFLHWPPTNDSSWLTRDLVIRLADDFHGLYDYLVDRDIIFDGTEFRPGQKWAVISRSGQNFRADSFELPFTDMVLAFDNRHGFPHIPYPYPITPSSVPVAYKPKSAFTLKKPTSPNEIIAQSRRKALSYAEASNVYTLRDQYMHTDLVTNFIRFEQSDQIESLDPFEARRGRWLLIYGILQVLATISVDSPNLRYEEGAQYHLCPQMKGVVPWNERGSPPEEEAEHTRSHCWLIPDTWAPTVPKARPGTHKPIIWGQYGDGRVRGGGEDRPRGDSMESIPTTKQQTSLVNGKTTDVSLLGRKRAEEWVNATTATTTTGLADVGSDSGMTVDEGGEGSSEGIEGRISATVKSEEGSAGGAGGSEGLVEGEGSKAEQRRRRAKVHGFSDFQPPREW